MTVISVTPIVCHAPAARICTLPTALVVDVETGSIQRGLTTGIHWSLVGNGGKNSRHQLNTDTTEIDGPCVYTGFVKSHETADDVNDKSAN